MAIAPLTSAPFPLEQAGASLPVAPSAAPGSGAVGEASFGDVFAELVASANAQNHLADNAAVMLAEGRSDDIHGTMIEGQKAAIQTRMVGQIKNKVVDAFYELWRMNI